jgi:hypothetical protein
MELSRGESEASVYSELEAKEYLERLIEQAREAGDENLAERYETSLKIQQIE